jgi:hypothetical protein
MADDGGKTASLLDLDRMADGESRVPVFGLGLSVIHSAREGLDLGGKGAAKCHVEFLDAAADGKQRNAALDCAANERNTEQIAGRIEGPVVFGFRLAIVGWDGHWCVTR